jgi:hypothetical protein
VSELEIKLAELRSQLVEPLPPQSPAGLSEAEQQLQEEAHRLQKNLLENLAGQLQAQVEENENLCFLNQEQNELLHTLQQAVEVKNQQAEDRKKILEPMENN